jgi:hypothetical protein
MQKEYGISVGGPIVHSEPYWLHPKRAAIAGSIVELADIVERRTRKLGIYRAYQWIVDTLRYFAELVNINNYKGNHIVGFNPDELFGVTTDGENLTLWAGTDEYGEFLINDRWSGVLNPMPSDIGEEE